MKTIFLPLVICCGFATAQNNVIPCYTMENLNRMINENPDGQKIKSDWENLNARFKELAENNKELNPTSSVVYTIPVVFHIIHIGGTENISKAQILDQMRILNEDFNRLNPDTVNTPAPFDAVAANCNIVFKLAQKDPNGACTDGIVRVYSPLTVNARDNVKAVSYWPNNKYFNIWVVKTINANGSPGIILGYAQFPGGPSATDGVVLRHDVVGSIGTSLTGPFPTNDGRTLSHEAGHWLGLRHIWGDNICASDFVNDTPEHEDANNGCPSFPYKPFNSCGGDGNGEMYVNYMDYTDGNCQNMFSAGQSARMNTILTTMRTNIWSNANLIATGTDGSPAVLCAPKADFTPVQQFICLGDSVRFDDASYNGQPVSRSWSFPGGTPSTSTDSMPWITYSAPGTYSVTLTVSNSAGSNSITKTNIIVVAPSTAQYSNWQYWEGFDNGMPTDWIVLNHQPSSNAWTNITTTGYLGGSSMKLTNSTSMVGHTDELVSPTMNLTQINQPKVYFYVAYAQRAADDNDILRVFVSVDCGQNWIQRLQKSGTTLKTVSPQTSSFTPTVSTQWRMETVSLIPYSYATKARFKFEFTSDGGNNIYIDQVNLGGPLSGEELLSNPFGLNIFPNPMETGATVVFTNDGLSQAKLEIVDITGKLILKLYEGRENGELMIPFDNSSLAAGIYFVKLDIAGRMVVKKLVVQ